MRLNNNRGMSLVEVLVASTFVVVVATAGLTSFNSFRNMKNRSSTVCRLHVANVVEKFRSIGYFAAIDSFVSTGTGSSRYYPGDNRYSLSAKGIPDSELWPSLALTPVQTAPSLNSSVLISSSINALLAIYNSSTSYCSNSEGAPYSGSGDLITAPSADLPNAVLNVKITPFSLSTGADLACTMPLHIAPEGRFQDTNASSPFYSTGQPALARRGAQAGVGLRLRVTERYTDEDGLNSACAIEQKFQYSPDLVAPSAPDFKAISPNNNPGKNASCPGSLTRNYTVDYGYQANTMEAGTVLVCRDRSVISATPAAGYTMASCQGAGAPAAQVVAKGTAPYYPQRESPSRTGLNFSPGYTAAANRSWVPCDRVTACGVNPSSSGLRPGSTYDRPIYRLTYVNLPLRCRVNIEVAAIDTAANASARVNTATAVAVPTLGAFFGGSTMISWDVPVPECGDVCGNCGANCGLDLASIYFRCGGCP